MVKPAYDKIGSHYQATRRIDAQDLLNLHLLTDRLEKGWYTLDAGCGFNLEILERSHFAVQWTDIVVDPTDSKAGISSYWRKRWKTSNSSPPYASKILFFGNHYILSINVSGSVVTLLVSEAMYDDMSKGKVDPSKWTVMSFPMENGQIWKWEEPKAKLEPRNGGLALTVDPFTRKHDAVHMFDDPKQLYGSTRTFPVSASQMTVFEVEMGCETYRSNDEDLRDAFAGFILMDFSTGMIFDFVSTGKKIGAIYERLLIPGVTDEKTAFTYLIESPFSGVRPEPGKLYHYKVRIDGANRRAEWLVDGKAFFKAEGIPATPKEIMMGWGLFTLNPVDPMKGSISVHGQGATGVWKNFQHRFE